MSDKSEKSESSERASGVEGFLQDQSENVNSIEICEHILEPAEDGVFTIMICGSKPLIYHSPQFCAIWIVNSKCPHTLDTKCSHILDSK